MSELVKIKFLTKKMVSPEEIYISNEEYFDDLEEGETYISGGIAKFQEPHRYLNMEPNELEWLVLTESLEHKCKVFRYQYMSGTDSYMVHTQWPNGDEEIIHSVNISPEKVMITRTSKEGGKSWATVICSLIGENEELTSLVGGKSYSELLAFNEVK